MNKLGNYIQGRWITGEGVGQVLFNAVNGNPIAVASS
jgi:oxepin-CoA hydrolase/3-oxo-5,6-dehydrosuberyl-CoA semialdehyde dehydrogenase